MRKVYPGFYYAYITDYFPGLFDFYPFFFIFK